MNNKKKMRLLFALMIILPLTGICQKNDTIIQKRISIGLSFSPDYCYRILFSQPGYEFAKVHSDSTEFPMFGFTTGANLSFRLNKRFTFETGLLFSEFSEIRTFDTLKPVSYNPTIPSIVVKGNFTDNLYFISLPLRVNFNILAKRAKLFIFTGTSFNIVVSKKTVTSFEFIDGNTSSNTYFEKRGIPDFNLSVMSGLGFSYDFSPHFYLQIEPVFRIIVNPSVKVISRRYPYSVGLNTGLFYRL